MLQAGGRRRRGGVLAARACMAAPSLSSPWSCSTSVASRPARARATTLPCAPTLALSSHSRAIEAVMLSRQGEAEAERPHFASRAAAAPAVRSGRPPANPFEALCLTAHHDNSGKVGSVSRNEEESSRRGNLRGRGAARCARAGGASATSTKPRICERWPAQLAQPAAGLRRGV